MISLADEFTDGKGRHARGWLFFDAECRFCVRLARWIGSALRARGVELAPLQDPRVSALLGLSRGELLRALRFVRANGGQFTGAEAILALACEIWWARPLVWLAKIPGVHSLLQSGYGWVAAKRGCAHAHCATVHG